MTIAQQIKKYNCKRDPISPKEVLKQEGKYAEEKQATDKAAKEIALKYKRKCDRDFLHSRWPYLRYWAGLFMKLNKFS